MPYIRSLTYLPDRFEYTFPDVWEKRFIELFQDTIMTEAHFLDCLESHIAAYVHEADPKQGIIANTMIMTKPVINYLKQIELWSRKLVNQLDPSTTASQQSGLIITPVRKLIKLLDIPERPISGEKGLAGHIALEYLEMSLDSIVNPPQRTEHTLTGESTEHYIKCIKDFKEIKNIRKLLGETLVSLEANCEQFTLFSPSILLREVIAAKTQVKNIHAVQTGRLIPEEKKHLVIKLGSKVVFTEGEMKGKADPISFAHARPLIDAQERFVRNLILLYQWGGGNAYAHRDGTGSLDVRPRTPFMRFLDCIKDALPNEIRPKGNAFHRMAQEQIKKIS